jgi:hypothetical protein
MKPGPVLFVGNSPNQLSGGGSSWAELMRALRTDAGVALEGHSEKPFTLHFEELLSSFRQRTLKHNPRAKRRNIDRRFKELIAQRMRKLKPNEVHLEIMRLPVTTLLTTNYDFCLEAALLPQSEPELEDWETEEDRYCLFLRRRAGASKFVFHIHGEIARPESIMLGHEAYVESCSNIRRYSHLSVRGADGTWEDGKGNFYPKAGWLKAKFRRGRGELDPDKPHSWVDLFMLRDVHIVGFGLEFTEVDIWYLISYKARLALQPEVPPDLKSSRIVFHYFADGDPKHLAKIALLKSFGVICKSHPITVVADSRKDYRGAWKKLLSTLKDDLDGGSVHPETA